MARRQLQAALRPGLLGSLLLGLLASTVSGQSNPTPTRTQGDQGNGQQVVPHGPTLWVTPGTTFNYVARGTMPLRDGWQYSDTCPFGLRREGVVYPAQWSPVAWERNGELSVVELAAVVERLPGDGVEQVPFEIVRVDPGFPKAYPAVQPQLLSAASVLGASWLRVVDSLGNTYVAAVSQAPDSPTAEIELVGRAKVVYRTQGSLVRIAGPGGPQRAGGFHAWFTFHSQSKAVELDLQWHNATVGTPSQMAPDIVFESVDLLLPANWRAQLKYPYPEQGTTQNETIYGLPFSVVELIDDGPTPHLLQQRAHLTWRTVLWAGDSVGEQHADDRREQLGWGSVQGAVNGWQDPLAAKWCAQHSPLPDLSNWQTQSETKMRTMRLEIEEALANGTAYFYEGVAQMGPYHSFGTPYGGMSGGAEIDPTPGAALMWTASRDGIVAHQALHRMMKDRQFGWFYDADGFLMVDSDVTKPDGSLPFDLLSNDFNNLDEYGDLGFSDVPAVYADVQPRPTYEGDLVGTNPYNGLEQYDMQHGVRATWPLKVLIWGSNDRMARHDLAGQAAMWQMEWHDGPGGGLSGLSAWADQHPNVAGDFGRGEAWATDAMAHWFAITPPEERDQYGFDTWMTAVVDVLRKLRTPLGVFYGNRSGKIIDYHEFDNQYAIIQWYEHGITLHAIATMLNSWVPDGPMRDELAQWLVSGTVSAWVNGWKTNTPGTYAQQAVAPIDPIEPAFANVGDIPADGFGGGPANSQLAGPIAYSLPWASVPQLMQLTQMAQALTEDEDPLTGLESLTFYFLSVDKRAPLLAWLQALDPLL